MRASYTEVDVVEWFDPDREMKLRSSYRSSPCMLFLPRWLEEEMESSSEKRRLFPLIMELLDDKLLVMSEEGDNV
jgi:hypothetical protein